MSIQISSYLSDNFSIIVSQLQILQGITINEIVGKNSNIETNEKKEIVPSTQTISEKYHFF